MQLPAMCMRASSMTALLDAVEASRVDDNARAADIIARLSRNDLRGSVEILALIVGGAAADTDGPMAVELRRWRKLVDEYGDSWWAVLGAQSAGV